MKRAAVPLLWLLVTVGCLAAAPAGQAQPRLGANPADAPALTAPDLQTLHCPWFFVGEDFVSLIVLKNVTAGQLNVYLTVRFGANVTEDGSYDAPEPVKLEPGEGRTLDLRRLRQRQRRLFGAASSGGLELTFLGGPQDLLAKTSVVSLRRRQSFDVPFVNPRLAASNVLDSVWWFIGRDYGSFVELKNTTNEDVVVTLSIRYGKSGVTEHVFAVPARQARAVNLRDLKPILGGAVSGSAELRHSGEPGAVVANLTALSPSSGLSFDAPFIARPAQQ